MIRLLLTVMFLIFLGCVANPRAASSPPAAAQPTIQFAMNWQTQIQTAVRPPVARPGDNIDHPPDASDPNEIRYWVSPAELTPDNWHTVGCVYMLKPECRIDSMRLLFAYYEKTERRPYLHCIVDNWLRVLPRRVVSRNGWLIIPTCEDAWQWGDLNADCRVDYQDLAIYGSVK
jgi:hypothetical protein